MGISTNTFAVEIIAHRGASYDAPENSLSAMTLAWRQGADQLETDIHLSKDGKIVVMHDFDTKRITGVDKKIVGPAYKDVAKKYAGDKGAKAHLVAKVKAGGKGVWGQIPMPPNPQVSNEDAEKIVSWILTLK